MAHALGSRLRDALPTDVEYASARSMVERSQYLSVRQDVLQPVGSSEDGGVMITIWHDGGLGYAATSDITPTGLRAAVDKARQWATTTKGRVVLPSSPLGHPTGVYESPVARSWDGLELAERIDLLQRQSKALALDDRIVDWAASLRLIDIDTLLVTNGGGEVEQQYHLVIPNLTAVANEGSNTQIRTYGAGAFGGQGGIEVLERHGFDDAAERIATEALQLLDAPNCPTGDMDVVLAPDQMVLQIHESIGHPLELDRILGDERNYAGTSFVTPEMFGAYQYGSELLNVTFDPTVPGQMATYGFDDDGTPAERQLLIENGILMRPLGGTISQERTGLGGVANSRACSWNRPPIDRMANLNVEPGDSTVAELIAGVERGVYMETNTSWSIDDSRNKFQFGCELGRMIEDGELKGIVRNPNYRGISATFWRSLSGVANRESFSVMGVPNCGKGEPNQTVRVGHASPHCRFSTVAVFGGEE